MSRTSLFHNVTAGLLKAAHEASREAFNEYRSYLDQELLRAAPHATVFFGVQYRTRHEILNTVHFFDYLIDILERIAMPAKPKNKRSNSQSEKYTFVRCELSSDDKKAAKVWIDENMAEVGPLLHDVIASDYKLSLTYSPDHDTFTACVTGREGSLNQFKTLSARHRDWVFSVMTVLYKHNVVFKAGVWEDDDDAGDDGWA